MQAQKNFWTLKDYILSLFREQKTQTPEFEAMVRIYGRDKIENWWKEYRLELKQKQEQSKLRVNDIG